MANQTIPDLTPAASFALTNLLEISDGTPASKSVTGTQIQAAVTSGFVPSSRTIATTAPLAGGGDLSANRTFTIADAAADGATKGAAAFAANDFDAAAGVISIDYTNGQAASAVNKGFLTSADWTTFNSKASTEAPFVDTTAIVKGSADATKLLRFEVDGFTGGTTRVVTPQNQNLTMAGIDVTQTFTQTQTFTPAANNRSINIASVSITGASSLDFMRITGTWNTSGTPSAMLFNITDTASNAASKLIELQISGTEVFSIGKTGVLNFLDGIRQTFNPNGTNSGINVGAHTADPSAPVNGDLWYESTLNELHARINGATVALGAGGGGSAPFIDSTAIIKGSADATKLFRIEVDGFTTATTRVATPPNQDFTMAGTNVIQTFTQEQTFTPPANTEAITVTGFSLTGANAQSIFDLAGTWNTSGAPVAIKLNITNTASVGGLLMDLQTGGVPMFKVSSSGSVVVANTLDVGPGSAFSVAANGSFSMAGGAFAVNVDGSFGAVSAAFAVDGSGNLQIFSSLSFGLSGFIITDNGSELETNSPLKLGGYLQLDNAAVVEIIVPDSTLIIRDSTGTAYKIRCLVA